MKRTARASFTISKSPDSLLPIHKKRMAEVGRIAVEKDKLFLVLAALHWEQTAPATAKERAVFGVSEVYAGNENGDLFEGGRNIIYNCKNPECTNPNDCSNELNRFLKYPQNDTCPWCGSPDIENWEFEVFGTNGELLSKNRDGVYRYETWKDEPVNVNHNDEKRIGKIEDVWIDPEKKEVVELISLERTGAHGNDVLCRKIEAGLVDSGSMELLTSRGFCSCCFHEHFSESDFCDHLKYRKGSIDIPSQMHIAEICKEIQGCGHAIIATGDPADSGAVVRQILAGKSKATFDSAEVSFDRNAISWRLQKRDASGNPIEGPYYFPTKREALLERDALNCSTILNHEVGSMASDTNIQGKPAVAQKANRLPDLSKVRRAEGVYSESKPLPAMNDMADQLRVFGNYDSTRTAEQIRLAGMTPEERAEYEEFQAFRAGKKAKASPSISMKPTLHVDKGFIADTLRAAVRTKKLAAKAVVEGLARLTLDKQDFTKALAARKLSANTLSRICTRKAALVNSDEVEETILDLIADALIESGERMKSQVSDTTYDDAFEGSNDLTDKPEDLSEFEDVLIAPEEKSEEDKELDKPLDDGLNLHEDTEPAVIHSDEDKSDFKPEPEDKSQENEEHSSKHHDDADKEPSDSLEEDMSDKETPKDKKEAQKTETFPNAEKHKPQKSPASRAAEPEEFPEFPESPDHKKTDQQGTFNRSTLKIALHKRAQALEASIGEGTGDVAKLVEEHTKITAQIKKLDSELGPPDPKALGGNGLDENAEPVGHVDSKKSLDSELSPPEPEELGGNGLDENAKPIGPRVASKQLLQEVKDAMARVKASITDPKAVSKKDIALLIEMGKLPKGYRLGQALPGARKSDTEEFPEATDAQGDLKVGQKEDFSKSDKKMIEQQNAEKDTPIGEGLKPEPEDKGWKDGTKPGKAIDKEIEDLGWDDVTPVGAAIKDEPKNLGWEDKELGTNVKADLDEEKENLGWDDGTKPGAAIKDEPKNLGWERKAQLSAEFNEPRTPGKISESNWTVYANEEPILRVALKHAYPGQVIKKHAQFASELYADKLVKAIRDVGVEAVHNNTFSGMTKLFSPAERRAMKKTAQANPTPVATDAPIGAPASVEPGVADKILNDAKPGISTLDLIATLIAPVVAESDTLSPASFVEDLVNIGQNQEKVTELTTKLETNVQTIKTQAGLPSDEAPADEETAAEQGADEAAPAPGQIPAPTASAPNPQVVQAMRAMKPESEAEKRWALKLQASRIEPVVLEEQMCGLIPGATQLHAQGLSRKQASAKAREIVQDRVAELMKLPEEAYLMVEREIRKACKRVKVEREAKSDPKLEERKARWEKIKAESGSGEIREGLGGDLTEADSNPKPGTSVPMSFKSAGGITKASLKKAMELREQRPARRD